MMLFPFVDNGSADEHHAPRHPATIPHHSRGHGEPPMTPTPETLTHLVATRVGEGRPLTYRAFEDRAIDPDSGYRPSKGTLWKVAHDQPIKLSPDLVRAIAAGLGLPAERVQRAAAFQYTGYIATDYAGGTIVHEPGVTLDQMPKARAALECWASEDTEEA